MEKVCSFILDTICVVLCVGCGLNTRRPYIHVLLYVYKMHVLLQVYDLVNIVKCCHPLVENLFLLQSVQVQEARIFAHVTPFYYIVLMCTKLRYTHRHVPILLICAWFCYYSPFRLEPILNGLNSCYLKECYFSQPLSTSDVIQVYNEKH